MSKVPPEATSPFITAEDAFEARRKDPVGEVQKILDGTREDAERRKVHYNTHSILLSDEDAVSQLVSKFCVGEPNLEGQYPTYKTKLTPHNGANIVMITTGNSVIFMEE